MGALYHEGGYDRGGKGTCKGPGAQAAALRWGWKRLPLEIPVVHRVEPSTQASGPHVGLGLRSTLLGLELEPHPLPSSHTGSLEPRQVRLLGHSGASDMPAAPRLPLLLRNAPSPPPGARSAAAPVPSAPRCTGGRPSAVSRRRSRKQKGRGPGLVW